MSSKHWHFCTQKS